MARTACLELHRLAADGVHEIFAHRQVFIHLSASCVSRFTQGQNIRLLASDGSLATRTRAVRSCQFDHADERSLEIFGQIWKFLDRPHSPRSIGVPINPDAFEAGAEM